MTIRLQHYFYERSYQIFWISSQVPRSFTRPRYRFGDEPSGRPSSSTTFNKSNSKLWLHHSNGAMFQTLVNQSFALPIRRDSACLGSTIWQTLACRQTSSKPCRNDWGLINSFSRGSNSCLRLSFLMPLLVWEFIGA